MPRISYKQARSDHEYLWSIAPAYDMTGGYVDQEDLVKLMRNPTAACARDCYVSQIAYWFQAGPCDPCGDDRAPVPWRDPKIWDIAERHGLETPET